MSDERGVYLFRGVLSGRVYVSTRWRVEDGRRVSLEKHDVTEAFNALAVDRFEGEVVKAQVEVHVYRAEDGLRWRIRSNRSSRKILSASTQGYSRKDDCFRSLLLTTGGTYERQYRGVNDHGHAHEQGVIRRRTPEGLIEELFVEYVSTDARRGNERTTR